MKATATAPANIALIKYWGKQDEKLRLPLNSSISMNLSACTTTTTVEFSLEYQSDDITFLQPEDSPLTTITRPRYVCQSRISQHLDRLRQRAGTMLYAKVITSNTFPSAAGIASSASGFAALTVAAAAALGLQFSEKELSIIARLGSGSACRSIPNGFVEWVAGPSTGGSEASYAYSLYPADYWDLRDILLIVIQDEKKVSSTAGMEQVKTSPLWQKRVTRVPQRITELKQALKEKNFQALGEVIEEDCLEMHAVMQSQKPPLYYWMPATVKIMEAVKQWRKDGLPAYFTIDAGPNMHLICEAKDEGEVIKRVKTTSAGQQIIVNKPVAGAHLVKEHLF